MIPRYAIIDELERDEFEKKWHMPWCYGASFYVTADPEDAIKTYNEIIGEDDDEPTSLIIEEFTDNSKTLFYRK